MKLASHESAKNQSKNQQQPTYLAPHNFRKFVARKIKSRKINGLWRRIGRIHGETVKVG
jgi:hypothetical protein